MTGLQEHTFTARFTEKEYYILSKLASAQGMTPEEYIHDSTTALFSSDIDNTFGTESVMYKELHKLDDELQGITAS